MKEEQRIEFINLDDNDNISIQEQELDPEENIRLIGASKDNVQEDKILNVIPTNDEYWTDDRNNSIIVNNNPIHKINSSPMIWNVFDNIAQN